MHSLQWFSKAGFYHPHCTDEETEIDQGVSVASGRASLNLKGV